MISIYVILVDFVLKYCCSWNMVVTAAVCVFVCVCVNVCWCVCGGGVGVGVLF